MSFVERLECPKCRANYNPDIPKNLCECGSPLLVKYDLMKVRDNFSKEDLKFRPDNIWRYQEVLPVQNSKNIITLNEGWTPLFCLAKLGEETGFSNLYLKDEGLNPSGTFKARGASAGVSKAKELGIKDVCMPTAGNAGAAWSQYCAKADIKNHVVMPEDAPDIAKLECYIAGADTFLVKGLISEAGKIISQAAEKYNWFEVTTLKEPYRIEGKKTMGYEIFEQMNFSLPDVIVYPCGGGVGMIGIWKAINEMKCLGWVKENELPKMIAVQSAGCAPIVKAFESNKKVADFWENASTFAGGIRVPSALGDFLILEAIYESEGSAVAVKDEEIKESIIKTNRAEGILLCPEGAATVASLEKLLQSGLISYDDEIVLLNTGSGLKYPNMVSTELPVLDKNDSI